MSFWQIAIRNLLRKRLRSIFAGVGIALATAVYVGMTNLVGSIAANWMSHYDAWSIHLLIRQKGQIDIIASSVPEGLDVEISRFPGVREAYGELLALSPLNSGGHMVVSGWPGDAAAWGQLDLVAGEVPQPMRDAAAVAGSGLAQNLGLKPGDSLDVLGAAVKIVAINETDNPLTRLRILVPLRFVQEMLFREGSVTVINVVLERADDAETVARLQDYLSERYPGLVLETTEEMVVNDQMIGLLEAISSTVSLVALVIGAAGVANIMIMAVSERQSELGLLSAIGWSRRRIFALITLEGILLSVPAGVLGGLLGILLARMVSTFSPLANFFSATVSVAELAAAVAIAVVLGLVGSLYPALRAVAIPPDTALRTV